MLVFSFLIIVLSFANVDNAKYTLGSSEDFNKDSKLPSESVQCELRDECVDDFYQSEQTGNTYLLKNLPSMESGNNSHQNKFNFTGRCISKINKLNVPDLLNSTDILSELNQVNGSIDVLKALLNEYTSTMEEGNSRTESLNRDEIIGNNKSKSKERMKENETTTMSSFLYRLLSNKLNNTKVGGNQTHGGIDGLNSSNGNKIMIDKEIVSSVTVEPFNHSNSVNEEPIARYKSNGNQTTSSEIIIEKPLSLNISNGNQTISEDKGVTTTGLTKELISLNTEDEIQNKSERKSFATTSEEKLVHTTTKSPNNSRNQLVIDEQDFKKFSQHILTSLQNIEDSIILLAKENSIISEEIRSMESRKEDNVNYHTREKSNFVEFLKVLYDLYQYTSDNLISIQNMEKSVNNELFNKNIYNTSTKNVSSEQTVVGDSRINDSRKLDYLETSTQMYEDGVSNRDLKYKIVIVGGNQDRILKLLKNYSPENSRSCKKSSDSVLGNVIEVLRHGFPESDPIVVEYDLGNDGRNSGMIPNVREILSEV